MIAELIDAAIPYLASATAMAFLILMILEDEGE